MSENEGVVVSMHTMPTTKPEKVINLYEDIYNHIASEGGEPVITRGVDTFKPNTGEFTSYTKIESKASESELIVKMGVIAVDAALNKAGKLNSEAIPLLNHPRLRNFCADKWKVRSLWPAAYADTIFVPASKHADLNFALDAIDGELAVIKRNRGLGSRHVFIGSKSEVLRDALAAIASGDIKPTDDLLVQPFTDTTRPMPNIRGINEEQASLLKLAYPKELRFYMLDDVASLVVARVGNAGENRLLNDRWAFVDTDSIPDEAVQLAAGATARIRQELNIEDSYIGVDIYWDNELETWNIRECNGRDPVYIKHAQNFSIARGQRQDIGEKLLAMGRRHRDIKMA